MKAELTCQKKNPRKCPLQQFYVQNGRMYENLTWVKTHWFISVADNQDNTLLLVLNSAIQSIHSSMNTKDDFEPSEETASQTLIPAAFCRLKCVLTTSGMLNSISVRNTIILVVFFFFTIASKVKTSRPRKLRFCWRYAAYISTVSFLWSRRNLREAVVVESCIILALNLLSQYSLSTCPKYPALLPSSSCLLVLFFLWIYLRPFLDGLNDTPECFLLGNEFGGILLSDWTLFYILKTFFLHTFNCFITPNSLYQSF